ncbi:unnamed protein product [Arabis nemorensis]|uniref:Uncharacterized protein n=1 Tax=Arabis nemorensis TaxID=586526 RepID=A0A565AXY7_9BRAS|nr:unnamed protein product [Arabis nemorensis]
MGGENTTVYIGECSTYINEDVRAGTYINEDVRAGTYINKDVRAGTYINKDVRADESNVKTYSRDINADNRDEKMTDEKSWDDSSMDRGDAVNGLVGWREVGNLLDDDAKPVFNDMAGLGETDANDEISLSEDNLYVGRIKTSKI